MLHILDPMYGNYLPWSIESLKITYTGDRILHHRKRIATDMKQCSHEILNMEYAFECQCSALFLMLPFNIRHINKVSKALCN